jgi:hypothetical protein
MGRDSNPRWADAQSSFQDCRLRPLGHPSGLAVVELLDYALPLSSFLHAIVTSFSKKAQRQPSTFDLGIASQTRTSKGISWNVWGRPASTARGGFAASSAQGLLST